MKCIKCSECGTPIYLEDETYQHRREDGKIFYCTNGHQQVFREPEIKKLREYNDYLRGRLSDVESTNKTLRHSINGYKGQLARLKNKIAALEGSVR
jgi:predicted  nucleic acid-binding Zn-ribbon protein